MVAVPSGSRQSSRRVGKQRLDRLLVERGLAASRAQARALVLAGRVLVKGRPCVKAGAQVAADVPITLKDAGRTYASRGGTKLAGALESLAIDPTDLLALDLGASTGGFTDCLLQHGARRVVAVDVGRGQFAWRLRQDARVELRERTNARLLTPDDFETSFDLATVDLSFISVRLILPVLAALLAPDGEAVVLVKPQFEVGKGEVGKGGVVRDARQQAAVVREVAAAARHAGFAVRGAAPSVLRGPKGNQEIFLHLARRSTPSEGEANPLEDFLTGYLSAESRENDAPA